MGSNIHTIITNITQSLHTQIMQKNDDILWYVMPIALKIQD